MNSVVLSSSSVQPRSFCSKWPSDLIYMQYWYWNKLTNLNFILNLLFPLLFSNLPLYDMEMASVNHFAWRLVVVVIVVHVVGLSLKSWCILTIESALETVMFVDIKGLWMSSMIIFKRKKNILLGKATIDLCSIYFNLFQFKYRNITTKSLTFPAFFAKDVAEVEASVLSNSPFSMTS